MKILIYSASFLLLLSSCGSSGGSGSGTSTPAKPLEEQLGEASSASDFSKVILPDRYSLVKANLSYDEQKEKYTVGCKTQGEPSYDGAQVDPQLLAGHTFSVKEGRSRLLSTDTYQTTERRIAERQGQRVKTEINFIESSFGNTPFTSIEQVFAFKPHIVTDATYTNNGTGDFNVVTNYTVAAREYLAAKPTKETQLNCSVSWDASFAMTVDKVMYPLGGHQVVAYLQKDSNSGEVTCDKGSSDKKDTVAKVSLGKGRRESIRITTNETVREGMLNCGGEDVFYMERIILDSGKVVKSTVQKTLSAPLR